MDKKIQNNITVNGTEITSYNNIDLDFSVSFNNLTYTLSYENNKKYLNNNSLLFNIEDTNTIYNIFKHNNIQFSYQLNNILFVDNNRNMHILSYNLRTIKTFSYENNLISFNILGNSVNQLKEFNKQTLFAYNSNQISYIYSNEDKLKYMTLNNPGLYNIDDDDIILNSNGQLSINVNKFNYDSFHINNLADKINNIIHDYSYNIGLFGLTKKYKDSAHIDNLQLINDNKDQEINFVTSNRSYKLNYNNEGIDLFIKDTDYFVIDFPIKYQYETVINNDFKFNQSICPIKIDDIKIQFNTNITSKIQLNKSKSFIHNHKPISIIPEYKNNFLPTILSEQCNVSLYFSIDPNIYEEVYKLDKTNIGNHRVELQIKCQDIIYKFNCYIDVMNNQFKKLYHNYNYGFNYDSHGEAIGIMMLPKYKDKTNIKINQIKVKIGNNLKKIDSDQLEFNPTSKDIYLNYNSKNINDILIKIDNINYNIFNQQNKFINFNKMYCLSSSEETINIYNDDAYQVIKDLTYPQRLKCKNLSLLYKNGSNGLYTIYEYPQIQNNSQLLLNPIFLNSIGTICQLTISNDTIVNNPYIMKKDDHKLLFDKIYNYRKSGLLCGDFYTPCLSDYMTIYLFGMEKCFDNTVYNNYNYRFCTSDKGKNQSNDENNNVIQNQYRLLTNQFCRVRYINDICQYSVNLTQNPYGISNINSVQNDDNLDFNKYYIELYQSRNIGENDQNYIWPLFRIPDYSIINSNNYIIMYSDKENCEYVDYYINPSVDGKYFYINFRSYNKDNDFSFKILDEKMNLVNNIQISSTNLIDKENNIYQMQIYIQNILKLNMIYIIFTDSEDYMNNITISNINYRILCKVYLKNKDI